MIVNSYDEAKPILLEQIALGKKLGHIAMGNFFHEGYQVCANKVKKYCDYSVCLYSTLYGLRAWGELYGKLLTPFGLGRFLYPKVAVEIEKHVDLVIMGELPLPPNNKDEIEEIKQFTSEQYINYNLLVDPEYSLNKDHHCIRTGYFSAIYYINKHYFPFSVRLKSYKDGLWRFIQEKTFISLNCTLINIAPHRNEFGLAYGNSNNSSDSLKLLSNGQPIITSKSETKENLFNKLSNTEWTILEYTKYSGNLLDNHKNEGDTYFRIRLAKVVNNIHSHYIDAFIV